MNKNQAIAVLRTWDNQAKYVFTKRELSKLFPEDTPKTLTEGLKRLISADLIERVCRGIYVNRYANSADQYTIERIAIALRYGEYNYISLESMLSEYGVISQIPIDRLTVMTTGRTATYKTPYGVIEFTHTKRPVEDILKNTQSIANRPLRIATKEAAWRDLKRVGRNKHLVNQAGFNDE